MIWNYIKTGFRNFQRKPIYAIINVVGLAIGLACFLLIIAAVTYEENFDKGVSTNEHLVHRLILKRYDPDTHELSSAFNATSLPIGTMLKDELKDNIGFVSKSTYTQGIFEIEANRTEENQMLFADAAFLKVFRCKILKGDISTMLSDPNSIVLTQKLAEKYFGNKNPIGKTINYYTRQFKGPLQISGVIAEFPMNSTFRPDALISLNSVVGKDKYYKPDDWKKNQEVMSFVTFKSAAQKEKAISLMPNLIEIGRPLVGDDNDWEFYFQPIENMRLHSDFQGQEKGVDSAQILLNTIKIVGLLIIIISWVNFINIATASATTRGREIGSRKALGAIKKDIIIQFFVEAILYNVLALILALGILAIVVKPFISLIQAEYTYEIFFRLEFLGYLVGIVLLGIFCSGLYPSLVLASFQPRVVMNSKKSTSPASERMRKWLVGVQFLISMVLLMATGIIFHQTIFMKNLDKGINVENVLAINTPYLKSNDKIISTYKNFVNALKDLPAVKIASASTSVPSWWTGDTSVRRQSSTEMKGNIRSALGIDENYFELYEIPILAGSNYTAENNKDFMILSDKARKSLHFDAISDVFDDELNAYLYDYRFKIKGVVGDYKHNLMDTNIFKEGLIFMPLVGTNKLPNAFSVKFEDQIDIEKGIASVKQLYDKFYPEDLFKYEFVSDNYDRSLEGQKVLEKMFLIFSSVAFLLMLMGVIGLSSFIANIRTAEVAIRKILGAKIRDVLKVLSKEFLVIFTIASMLAIPTVWYIMNLWLQENYYRIAIGVIHFVIPMLIIFGFTLIVVLYNTLRVFRIHPSKALSI